MRIVEPTARDVDLDVEVTPSNPQAARIGAKIRVGGTVVLFFGQGGVFEVPPGGGRYTNRSQLDEIEVLCSAVLEGRYEEVVTRSGRDIVGARAKVVLADGPVSEVWREASWKLFTRKQKELYTYAPY